MHEDIHNELDDDEEEQVTKKNQCHLWYKQLSYLYDHVIMTHEECFTGMIEAATQMKNQQNVPWVSCVSYPHGGSLDNCVIWTIM